MTAAKTAARPSEAKAQARARGRGRGQAAAQAKAEAESEAARNAFKYRLREAPQSVKDDWAEVKDLPVGDPRRDELFELIKSVKKGDYSGCKLTVHVEIDRTSGMLAHAWVPDAWLVIRSSARNNHIYKLELRIAGNLIIVVLYP